MGHHWRQKSADAKKPSPLMEFLGLFLAVFHPGGLKGEWMPFDPSPGSRPEKPVEYES